MFESKICTKDIDDFIIPYPCFWPHVLCGQISFWNCARQSKECQWKTRYTFRRRSKRNNSLCQRSEEVERMDYRGQPVQGGYPNGPYVPQSAPPQVITVPYFADPPNTLWHGIRQWPRVPPAPGILKVYTTSSETCPQFKRLRAGFLFYLCPFGARKTKTVSSMIDLPGDNQNPSTWFVQRVPVSNRQWGYTLAITHNATHWSIYPDICHYICEGKEWLHNENHPSASSEPNRRNAASESTTTA